MSEGAQVPGAQPIARLSGRKRLLFVLGAMALVVVPLLGAATAWELRLRAKATAEVVSPRLPEQMDRPFLLVTSEVRRRMLERYTDEQGRPRVRTDRQMVQNRFMHDLHFSVTPEPGVKRIFCFGGSATLGVPFEREPETAFPARLAYHLNAAGLTVEVINLGGGSFGSDQVLELIQEVLAYGPSALVVYSGNNEFFNYHLKLEEMNRTWTFQPRPDGLLILGELRTLMGQVRGLDETPEQTRDRLMGRRKEIVSGVVRLAFEEDGKTALPRLRDGRWERQDRHYRAVVARHRANFTAIRDLVAASNPRPLLVLSDVPANLMESPWLALHHPDLSREDQALHSRLIAQGKQANDTARPREALVALDQAIALDPIQAMGHFYRGIARIALGDNPGAIEDLENALALDMEQGRPVRPQAGVVRELCDGNQVLLFDPEPTLRIRQEPALSWNYFHDACHLHKRTSDLFGRMLATLLAPRLR